LKAQVAKAGADIALLRNEIRSNEMHTKLSKNLIELAPSFEEVINALRLEMTEALPNIGSEQTNFLELCHKIEKQITNTVAAGQVQLANKLAQCVDEMTAMERRIARDTANAEPLVKTVSSPAALAVSSPGEDTPRFGGSHVSAAREVDGNVQQYFDERIVVEQRLTALSIADTELVEKLTLCMEETSALEQRFNAEIGHRMSERVAIDRRLDDFAKFMDANEKQISEIVRDGQSRIYDELARCLEDTGALGKRLNEQVQQCCDEITSIRAEQRPTEKSVQFIEKMEKEIADVTHSCQSQLSAKVTQCLEEMESL
jgi:hypothetical protein